MVEGIDTHELVSTRSRLLDAARDAFADKGFHGTTTRDISAAAGMSPAAVYVHHRSKEGMLYEISLAGHRDTLDRLQAVPTTDAVEALRRRVHALVLSHAEAHTTARVVNYELGALSPEHRAEIDRLRSQIQSTVRDVIEQGTRDGVFECDDIDMTANAIMGMAIDVARWYQDPSTGSGRRPSTGSGRRPSTGSGRRPSTGSGQRERSWPPERVADHHARMALRMVGVQPTGSR